MSATMFGNSKRQRAPEWQEPIPVWHATQDTYQDTAVSSVKQFELSWLNPRSESIMHNKITVESNYSNDEECSLCLCSMLKKTVSYTPCRHVFHTDCFNMQYQYQIDNQKSKEIKCAECWSDLSEATKAMDIPKKTKKITITQV
jgi:hypothetical protein